MTKFVERAIGFGGRPFVEIPALAKQFDRAPTPSDKNFQIGFTWIYVNGDARSVYIFSGIDSSKDAVWALSSPGDTSIDTINNLPPSTGNITITGGTNITNVNAGSTVTLNLDASITLVSSVSSPLYTAAAADLAITSATGQDIIMKMGDNAGANKVSFKDSDDAEVFAIDSDGTVSLSGLTVAGAFTQTGGAVSISEDNSANAVGIANGNTARVVDIATSAAAHVVSIGSVTGAASLSLKAGTGNFTLDGAAATTYTIGESTTDGTISIGGTAQTGTIALGDSSGINIVQIGSGEGATTVNIASGATDNKAVNISTGAVSNAVTIGSVSSTSSLDLLCGTGNFTLEGDVASTYDISSTGANTGTCTFGGGTGSRIVNLATGGTGVKTVNIATAAIGNIVTIGSVTAAASLDLLCGTGNFTLEGDTTSTYDISSTGANTGTCTFGGGTGARIVNLATGGTGIKTVNIATGDIDNVVTLGSVTGAASLSLLAGTGDITVIGTVKEINAEFLKASGDEITSFTQSPILTTADDTGGAPTGGSTDLNLMYCQQGVIMEQWLIGTHTIIAPRMDANGLLVSLDKTNSEGVEYNFGAGRSNSRHTFTIGSTDPFFFEVGLYINDMDGAGPYIIGFRKIQNNTVYSSYTDYSVIGMVASFSTTNIITATELNAGGTVLTDTTDAWGGDGATNTLKVLVSGAGVVTYMINGVAPSTTAAFTFDDGDTIAPFIQVHHSANATEVNLTSLKVGFQA